MGVARVGNSNSSGSAAASAAADDGSVDAPPPADRDASIASPADTASADGAVRESGAQGTAEAGQPSASPSESTPELADTRPHATPTTSEILGADQRREDETFEPPPSAKPDAADTLCADRTDEATGPVRPDEEELLTRPPRGIGDSRPMSFREHRGGAALADGADHRYRFDQEDYRAICGWPEGDACDGLVRDTCVARIAAPTRAATVLSRCWRACATMRAAGARGIRTSAPTSSHPS